MDLQNKAKIVSFLKLSEDYVMSLIEKLEEQAKGVKEKEETAGEQEGTAGEQKETACEQKRTAGEQATKFKNKMQLTTRVYRVMKLHYEIFKHEHKFTQGFREDGAENIRRHQEAKCHKDSSIFLARRVQIRD